MSRAAQIKLFYALEPLFHLKNFYVDSELRNINELIECEKALHKAIDGKSKEDKQLYYESQDLDIYYFEEIYPQLIRKTVFLQIYFILENCMNIVCDVARDNKSLKLSYKDIKGQGIVRAKTYLTKVCSIREHFSTKNWELILEYNKLRNVIAHNSSILKEDFKIKPDGVKVFTNEDGEKTFELEEDFIPKCIKSVEKFIYCFRDI
ncbi:hypothetical protein [Bacillus pumilus]|uniref:hypothetical protein n=1 Tax=Bacillus pumilus TaxID=1408 RepID=UPI000D03EDD8|nr:hypothetical protein [Bacillus pumilus]PRS29864.1 hypothetical protein C6X99_01600 [Bacillus pumilus]